MNDSENSRQRPKGDEASVIVPIGGGVWLTGLSGVGKTTIRSLNLPPLESEF